MTLIWEKKVHVTANVRVEATAHSNNTWSVTAFKYTDRPLGERVYFFQGRQMTQRGTLKQVRKRYKIAADWVWDTFSTDAERCAALRRFLDQVDY